MVQPCVWVKEEQTQFSMGQTAQSLTYSIMVKQHTRLDECPTIILLCFKARSSGARLAVVLRTVEGSHVHGDGGDEALALVELPLQELAEQVEGDELVAVEDGALVERAATVHCPL